MELGREKKVSHWVIYRFLVPNNPSPSSFLADAWANRDLGLTLYYDQQCGTLHVAGKPTFRPACCAEH